MGRQRNDFPIICDWVSYSSFLKEYRSGMSIGLKATKSPQVSLRGTLRVIVSAAWVVSWGCLPWNFFLVYFLFKASSCRPLLFLVVRAVNDEMQQMSKASVWAFGGQSYSWTEMEGSGVWRHCVSSTHSAWHMLFLNHTLLVSRASKKFRNLSVLMFIM